ncbi:MAG: hypothetical protein H0X26_02165 [Alphaproteobacteria bacterium]|nr:hypothetical protein [Alphaproteobacteria bacterium]
MRTIIFSAALLTMSGFSVQAMGSDSEDEPTIHPSNKYHHPGIWKQLNDEENKVRTFCARYTCLKNFANIIYWEVKGQADVLNKYGVPTLDYTAAFILYTRQRKPDEFKLLFDLFTKMPQDKRSDAFEELNIRAQHLSSGFLLSEHYYDSNNNWKICFRKPEGALSLKEKLLELSEEPKENVKITRKLLW